LSIFASNLKDVLLSMIISNNQMKVFNIVFIILFIFFAALQYNDPDPYIWMPLYLYAAFLCYLALNKKYNRNLYFAGFVVYSAYALYLLFEKNGAVSWIKNHHAENIADTMEATKPWIEETREFFGLTILIAVLIINRRWLKRKNSKVNDANFKPAA